MPHEVFISYSSDDRSVADTTCAALEQRGIHCWIAPRDLTPGRPYGEEIIDAINGAKLLLLVFSSHSNRSHHVPNEIERAVSKGVPILPFRIEDVYPSKAMEIFISSTHWLDAFTPPLERYLDNLAQKVHLLITEPDSEEICRRPDLEDRILHRAMTLASQLVAAGRPGRVRKFWTYVRRDLQDEVSEWAGAETDPFLVVVDGAGHGKTILLSQLADEWARAKEVLPLFVRCDNLDPSLEIDQAITSALGLPRIDVVGLLDLLAGLKRRPILMIDTLDLLPKENLRDLRRLANKIIDRGGKILGSCRPLEFTPLSDTAARIELKAFSRKEIEQILSSYREKEGKEPPELTAHTEEMFRIPLHLRMFLEIYQPEQQLERINFVEMFGHYWSQKVENDASRYIERHQLEKDQRNAFLAARGICVRAFLLASLESRLGALPPQEVVRTAEMLHDGASANGPRSFLSDALRDLLDEGVFVHEGSNRVRLFHQFFHEFSLARLVLDPLMIRSYISAEPRDPFLSTIETLLVEAGFLSASAEAHSAWRIGRRVLDLFTRESAPSTVTRRALKLINAFVSLGSSYPQAIGSVIMAILLRRDLWEEEILARLAASDVPALKNLARDYYATLRDKAPHLMFE